MGGYLSRNPKEVAFRFFNGYSFLYCDEKNYFRQLKSKKPVIHVYSNVTLRPESFHVLFNELFVPKASLREALDECLSQVGGKYVSVSFRFINLLGDFKDHWYNCEVLSPEQKEDYVGHGLKAIERLYQAQGGGVRKVLVTSDSELFLERAGALPFVYVIPGRVNHMDVPSREPCPDNPTLKCFLDFFMISKAEECYSYKYGRMYGSTHFAETAALVGGKHIRNIRDVS